MAGAADLTSAPTLGTGATALTLAKDAYQKAVAKIGTKRAQTMQQYGYRAAGYDDQGNPTGLQVDQYNQYGEFQKMLHDDALLSMQAQDDSVGRGLGAIGGGLGNQAQSEAQYQHGERSYEMGRLFTNEMTGINEDRLGADQDYLQAQWEAQRQAALDAMAAQQWAPAGTSGNNTGGDDTGGDDGSSDGSTTSSNGSTTPGASTPYIDAAAAAQAAGYGGYINSAGRTETNRALAAAKRALARA